MTAKIGSNGGEWAPPEGKLCGSIKACCNLSTELKAFHDVSPIGWLIERTFSWAQFISLATLLWGTRAYSHQLPEKDRTRFEVWRSRRVDCYIVGWFLALIGAHVVAAVISRPPVAWVLSVLAVLRVLDIIQANVNMHVLDAVRLPAQSHHVASLVRSSLISVWNYGELVGWYALFYFFSGGLEGDCGRVACPFDAIYFSTITQLTIGFGDLKPIGTLARLLAMSQGLMGTLFLIFAIGRFASLLPRVRDHGDA